MRCYPYAVMRNIHEYMTPELLEQKYKEAIVELQAFLKKQEALRAKSESLSKNIVARCAELVKIEELRKQLLE